VISEGVEVLSNYGWAAGSLWAVLGSVLAGSAPIIFWGLGFAGTAMPSGLYWGELALRTVVSHVLICDYARWRGLYTAEE
jgi:hypothetical protein